MSFTVRDFTSGERTMMQAKKITCGPVLACCFFLFAGLSALADDKKDKPALSGTWVQKEGEHKIEFTDKNVMNLFPHGENKVIVIVCEYTVEKENRVKAKITGFEGSSDEAKNTVKEIIPVGTEFSFQWKVKDGAAKLDDLKCDKAEQLKSHLEGEYQQKK
jgi:hypothetical protein